MADNFWLGLLLKLTDQDIASIGTAAPLEPARRLISACEAEDDFSAGRQCFWSCLSVREQASQVPGFATDAQFKSLARLFRLCMTEVQPGPTRSRLAFAVSRVYAQFARGIVHVFLGSDKPSEPAGLTIGNNFWEAELPVLQLRKAQGIVTEILVHVQGSTTTWEDLDVPLWRRDFHPSLDDPVTRPSFIEAGWSQEQWDQWRQEEPRRKPLTLRKLRGLVSKFRSKIHSFV